ncbi:MAG: cytochrome c [bacterium]|jgi:cytochrome c2
MPVMTCLRRAALVTGCTLLGSAASLHAQAGQADGKTPVSVDEEKARAGAAVWAQRACAACHTIGEGRTLGPDLAGVLERRERAWLVRWLKAPDAMLRTDSTAKALLAEFNGIRMPNLGLTDEEIEALLHYLAQESADVGKT